jgi:hypothetical protein
MGITVSIVSCSRFMLTEQIDRSGATQWDVDRCIISDDNWTSHLVYKIVDAIHEGKAQDVYKELHEFEVHLKASEMLEDGVECEQTLLLSRDSLVKKLKMVSDECNVDINIIRFIPIGERTGFVHALIVIVNDKISRDRRINI